MNKKCNKCRKPTPLTDFPRTGKKEFRRGICRRCYNAYHRGLYKKNKAEYIARVDRNREAIWTRILSNYGSECVMCGETDEVVLTVDHINDDGSSRRRAGEKKGLSFYRWIEDNDYPNDLQVLCRNCNWRKYMQNVQRLSEKSRLRAKPKRRTSKNR